MACLLKLGHKNRNPPLILSSASVLISLLTLCAPAASQQRARYQMFAQLVDLSESGQSIPAVISGEALEITDKWSIRNENLLAQNAQGYFFGAAYTINLKKYLEHTQWNHEDFEGYLVGTLGKVYSERNFMDRSAIGGFFGGGVSFLPKHSEKIEFQVFEIRAARLPHVHGGLAILLSTGIQVGF